MCNNTICPYSKKSVWALDRYWYPKQFERWQTIVKSDFIDHNKWVATNLTLDEYMVRWNHSEIPDEPSEKCIREFAEHNNLDYETALKYFKNTCSCCGKPIRHKYEIGMSIKYGMGSNNYLCKNCFCDIQGIVASKYDEILESFRYRSCDLV